MRACWPRRSPDAPTPTSVWRASVAVSVKRCDGSLFVDDDDARPFARTVARTRTHAHARTRARTHPCQRPVERAILRGLGSLEQLGRGAVNLVLGGDIATNARGDNGGIAGAVTGPGTGTGAGAGAGSGGGGGGGGGGGRRQQCMSLRALRSSYVLLFWLAVIFAFSRAGFGSGGGGDGGADNATNSQPSPIFAFSRAGFGSGGGGDGGADNAANSQPSPGKMPTVAAATAAFLSDSVGVGVAGEKAGAATVAHGPEL